MYVDYYISFFRWRNLVYILSMHIPWKPLCAIWYDTYILHSMHYNSLFMKQRQLYPPLLLVKCCSVAIKKVEAMLCCLTYCTAVAKNSRGEYSCHTVQRPQDGRKPTFDQKWISIQIKCFRRFVMTLHSRTKSALDWNECCEDCLISCLCIIFHFHLSSDTDVFLFGNTAVCLKVMGSTSLQELQNVKGLNSELLIQLEHHQSNCSDTTCLKDRITLR